MSEPSQEVTASSISMTPSPGRDSRWKIFREWATFILAIIAFISATITAYMTSLRTLDELRVLVESEPHVFFSKEKDAFSAGGGVSALFINSGNRPVSVVSASVEFGKVETVRGRTRCQGALFQTNFQSTVIE